MSSTTLPPEATITHVSQSELTTTKVQVQSLLKENPSLTALPLCKKLGLPWPQYKSYVENIRSEFRAHLKNRSGLIGPKFHGRRWFVYLPGGLSLDRDKAVSCGWVRTRARNRMLVWRGSCGRMEWFETNRVNLHVRSGVKGHVLGLFCEGFSHTGLISDDGVLGAVIKNIRVKGAHAVFEVGEKLPSVRIDYFKQSNGVTVKLGDGSHPTAVEVEYCIPDWLERFERHFDGLSFDVQAAKSRLDKRVGVV